MHLVPAFNRRRCYANYPRCQISLKFGEKKEILLRCRVLREKRSFFPSHLLTALMYSHRSHVVTPLSCSHTLMLCHTWQWHLDWVSSRSQPFMWCRGPLRKFQVVAAPVCVGLMFSAGFTPYTDLQPTLRYCTSCYTHNLDRDDECVVVVHRGGKVKHSRGCLYPMNAYVCGTG